MMLSRYACYLALIVGVGATGCSAFPEKLDMVQVGPASQPAAAESFNEKGVGLLRKGRYRLAERAFRNAIQADATFGPAHNNLGLVHFETGSLYESAWSFQRASEFMPQHGEPLNNLGLAYQRAGRLDEAIDLYYSAYELDAGSAEFLGNLVRARVLRGDLDEQLRLELRELLMIERREGWIEWAEDQLALHVDKRLFRTEADDELVGETADAEAETLRAEPLSEPLLTPPEPLPQPAAGPGAAVAPAEPDAGSQPDAGS